MDKSVILISFLCLLTLFCASNCSEFGDVSSNVAEEKHIVNKRSPSSTTPLKEYKSDNKSLYVNTESGFELDIDEPESEINDDIAKHNLTSKTDYHVYYNSSIVIDKEGCERHFKELGKLKASTELSHSYRRAMTIKLTFDFPFYGHAVQNITIATGGFLYTGEHVHSWLADTQYIAPLMANFKTIQSNDSFIKTSDNGTAFTVLWEKVRLQDNEKHISFTFSATLYKNGDITFAYYAIPLDIQNIEGGDHPVKVGLSDAYIIDKTISFARRRIIYEYHRVNFDNIKIKNNTMIYMKALTTCHNYTDCQSCTQAYSTLSCVWCSAINRCSTGTDRKRQEWLQKGCNVTKLTNAAVCPKIGEKGNDYKSSTDEFEPKPSTTESTVEKSNSVTQSSRINNRKMNLDEHNDNNNNNESSGTPPVISAEHHDSHTKSVKATMILLPIGIVLAAALWAFYAYRNPHSKSGQFLIQYRPSQWGWRRGEAHYTAAVQQ